MVVTVLVTMVSLFPIMIIIGENAMYNFARVMMDQGDYLGAQNVYSSLSDDTMVNESKYVQAKDLYIRGEFQEALEVFVGLEDYKNSKQYVSLILLSLTSDTSQKDNFQKEQYMTACDLYEKEQFQSALDYFRRLGNYKDSEELCQKCILAMRKKLVHTISAGIHDSICINQDGTIVSTGNNPAFNYTEWNNIVSVSNTGSITIGLKADGTVVTTGDFPVDVSEWCDIVSVSAGERYIVGLTASGTVLGAGHDAGDGQLQVTNWTDIVAIATGWRHTVGLDIDGGIYITGYGSSKQLREIRNNSSQWENIIEIAAGGGGEIGLGHTVGLRSDGTVVAVGDNTYGQCDVSDWKNIIAIAAGDWHTVGLCSDGTVVSTRPSIKKFPDMYIAACDVEGWTDIDQVVAGCGYTLGLRSDGTVVANGYNDSKQCSGTQSWTNVKTTNDSNYS